MKALGILGFIISLLIAIGMSTPLNIILDVPALLIVICATVFLALAKHGFKTFFTLNTEVGNSLINLTLINGGIGFVVGLVQMLHNFSDPSLIGPGMATSLLSLTYALILAACLYASNKSLNTKKIAASGIAASISAFLPIAIMVLSLSK